MDDGDALDTNFTLGENVYLSFTYSGKVTIDTVDYPVLTDGTFYYVMNIGLPVGSYPTFSTIEPLNPVVFPTCFAAGTRISTVGGDRIVETLEIDDLLRTDDGRVVTVKWIGHQTILPFFAGPRMQPVRIRAGALGAGLPHEDLTITADHGLVIDGLVINASALVNGGSIDWVPLAELPERVTYYHIETENHDVILANGAPAETFIDYAGRQAFDNYQEYVSLYGCERIIPEMDRPRISDQRLVPDAIRARLGIPAAPEFDWGDPDLRDAELRA